MLTGQDILCISSIDWDFIWQGHQEIMASFARNGNRVLFIENTGIRAPRLRDFSRLWHRLANWRRSTKGFRQERENLYIYSPLILPFPYSRVARWINRTLLLQALRRWMRAIRFRHPIIWTFLPTPLVLDVIRELDPELTVYYCIDDFASSSPGARRIRRSETQLFQQADLVFVTSEQLRQRAAQSSPRVHLFPFGVEFEQFERVRQGQDGLPDEFTSLPRPIVGYIGGLHQWVDQELLVAAAEQLPHASFALVGPAQTDVERLSRCRNIHLFGARSHDQIPHYIKAFDVGLIPYRLSDYTTHVYPTKLNEYLAMGIPVVATDLPEIRRFIADHSGVVAVAQTPGQFVDAIREGLKPNSEERRQQRIDVSRGNSWQARIGKMSGLIEQSLAVKQRTGVRWQESLRRLYRTMRRRVMGTAVAVAIGYVLLFKSPLVWLAAAPLRMAEPASQADAIVVFAGGVGESGQAGEGYLERIRHAIDLYRAGLAPRLILSSGYSFVFKEAEIMRDLAVSHGVPASAIELETTAANTMENVVHTSQLLAQKEDRQILLVSSPYHMRRAVWTFRKLAPGLRVIPAPVPRSRFYAHGAGAELDQIQGILHEYLSILYYWWNGWI